MPDQQKAGPAKEPLPVCRVSFREKNVLPFPFQTALAQAHHPLDALVEAPRIGKGAFPKAFIGDFEGQHDLQVIGRV